MFGTSQHSSKAYAKVGIETGVLAANPHKLIVMLFEGALVATAQALGEMRAGRIEAKGNAISKAIAIIENGLRASLNKDVGGDIALNLDALYQYMSQRLVTANLQNDPLKIDEVRNLLLDLKAAWESISQQTDSNAAPPVLSETNASNLSAPASSSSVHALSAYRNASL